MCRMRAAARRAQMRAPGVLTDVIPHVLVACALHRDQQWRGVIRSVRSSADGGTHFRVWAPAAKQLTLVIDGREVAMEPEAGGYFSLLRPRCRRRHPLSVAAR